MPNGLVGEELQQCQVRYARLKEVVREFLNALDTYNNAEDGPGDMEDYKEGCARTLANRRRSLEEKLDA